jgi:uncharacterized membrane protein YfcA
MTMRFANILCVLTVVVAVAATVLSLINIGHFDWKPLAKGATLITIVVVAWISARQRSLKGQLDKAADQPPRP